VFGTDFEDELGQGEVSLKKLKENLAVCLDFDDSDDIIVELGTYLIQQGRAKKQNRSLVRDIMDFIIQFFEGCKANGDLEYEVWK